MDIQIIIEGDNGEREQLAADLKNEKLKHALRMWQECEETGKCRQADMWMKVITDLT